VSTGFTVDALEYECFNRLGVGTILESERAALGSGRASFFRNHIGGHSRVNSRLQGGQLREA
jgi:hypothetical protein